MPAPDQKTAVNRWAKAKAKAEKPDLTVGGTWRGLVGDRNDAVRRQKRRLYLALNPHLWRD